MLHGDLYHSLTATDCNFQVPEPITHSCDRPVFECPGATLRPNRPLQLSDA